MKIALIAHNRKKNLLAEFCLAYSGILKKHTLCATGFTANAVSEATKLPIEKLQRGNTGVQQISASVSMNDIDMVIFFRDFNDINSINISEVELLRLCDVHKVPYATNIATAEVLIQGLNQGYMDWRDNDLNWDRIFN